MSENTNVAFSSEDKTQVSELPARIARVFYVDTLGQEIAPSTNRDYVTNLGTHEVLVYSCGSLWTRSALCYAVDRGERLMATEQRHAHAGTQGRGRGDCVVKISQGEGSTP
jgi:hypothetical protein